LLDAALEARPSLEALIFDGDGTTGEPGVVAALHEAVGGLQAFAV